MQGFINPVKPNFRIAPESRAIRTLLPYGRGALDLAIETASIQVARLGCTGRQDFIVSVAG